MSVIALSPIVPVAAIQGAAQNPVLLPGSVVDAQVLQILSDDLVRIAISGLTIDATSFVPLQTGQALRLAVSQTGDGLRLAITDQPASVADAQSVTQSRDQQNVVDQVTLTSTVASSERATGSAPARPAILSDAEAAATVTAIQGAAPKQGSLAPLFADLATAVSSEALPNNIKLAAGQVLALRQPLNEALDGGNIENAFRQSGLFLEAGLATSASAPGSVVPDLKAALLVLRQTLLAVSPAGQVASNARSTEASSQPNSSASAKQSALTPAVAADQSAASPSIVPNAEEPLSSDSPALAPNQTAHGLGQTQISPDLAAGETEAASQLSRPNSARATSTSEAFLSVSSVAAASADSDTPVQAMLRLLQEGSQAQRDTPEMMSDGPATSRLAGNYLSETPSLTRSFGAHGPPPPFRGALPTPQAIAEASLPANAPAAQTVRHLLDDTDAALARTTLLQIASLSGADLATASSPDITAPRWSFEIPFATPLGTAIAQFEISRDDAGPTAGRAAQRSWQARFSLDVEPAGPVHALVSWSGEHTSVRLWAERPDTTAQLRASTAQLNYALRLAELSPGDISVRDGVPMTPTLPPAGHFINRAS